MQLRRMVNLFDGNRKLTAIPLIFPEIVNMQMPQFYFQFTGPIYGNSEKVEVWGNGLTIVRLGVTEICRNEEMKVRKCLVGKKYLLQ